mgnify:CR=1 FL=1
MCIRDSGIVLAGPIAAGLAGAGAGGITGGLIGALIGSGIPEERAKVYESGVKAVSYTHLTLPTSDLV